MFKRYAISLVILLSATTMVYGSEGHQEKSVIEKEVQEASKLDAWFTTTKPTADDLRSGDVVMVAGQKYEVDKIIERPSDQSVVCKKEGSNCTHCDVEVVLYENAQPILKTEYWSLQGNFGTDFSNNKKCLPRLLSRGSNFPFVRWSRAESNPYWQVMFQKPNAYGRIQSNDFPGKEYQCTDSQLSEEQIHKSCTMVTNQRILQRKEDMPGHIHQENIVMREITKFFTPLHLSIPLREDTAFVKKISFTQNYGSTYTSTPIEKKKMRAAHLFVTTVAALGVGCKIWSMYQNK
jgi:hypothetical protein